MALMIAGSEITRKVGSARGRFEIEAATELYKNI